MSHLSWRKFRFFEKDDKILTDTGLIDKLKQIPLSCMASGKGSICFGGSDGIIRLLDRGFQKCTELHAFTGFVASIQQLKLTNLLVASGRENDMQADVIKVFNLDKFDMSNQPVCMRTIQPYPSKDPITKKLTCFAVHENLTLLVTGFDDGSLVLLKGDVSKEHSGKFKILENHPADALTNLFFTQSGPYVAFFATTETKVWSYRIDAKYEHVQKLENEKGCRGKCAVMSETSQENHLVTGLQEAVYFYTVDEKGQCLAFEGEKTSLAWHKNYLITITKETITPLVGKEMVRPVLTPVRDMFTVSVYDVANKYTAFSLKMTGLQGVVCEWGSIFLIGMNNSISQLRELDTQKKLDILFNKNQFDMAISLAKTQQYDKEGLTDIFKQYGDYLYQRGDYDGAVQQYIKTIDRLEPSYVIRKFLDAHRIHNLTLYLQQIHLEKKAKAEHTTLLLNCYTKLKDTSELDRFITSEEEKSYDVQTVIKVCREAQYFTHALKLASLKHEHQWYVRILLEDLGQYEEALKYLKTQSFEVVKKNLIDYGKQLVDALPRETTDLLKKLCTNFGVDPITKMTLRADPDDYIKLYVMKPDYLVDFLEYMTSNVANLNPIVFNTLFELYLKQYADWKSKEDTTRKAEHSDSPKRSAADRPSTVVESKAMSLLRDSKSPYDMDQALILCQMHDFREGILYLYEKAHLYKHIMKYHMDHLEFDKVIEMCKAHGDNEPSLWRDALVFFGKHEQSDGLGENLKYILRVIEERELLSPLLVVQSLAQNTDVKVGVLKEYLVRKFKQESNLIEEEEREIEKLKTEISNSKKRIQRINNEPQQFPEKSKCSHCSQELDNPSIHFYCRHSYHQHCDFSENGQCPLCVADTQRQRFNDQWASISNRNQLNEEFHAKLSKTGSDGFSVVSQYYGFGVFNDQK